METLDEPIDLLKLSLAQQVFVKLRNQTELRGILVSYDEHFNLILSKAEEIQIINGEKQKRKLDALYLRGDGIILVSPLSKGVVEL